MPAAIANLWPGALPLSSIGRENAKGVDVCGIPLFAKDAKNGAPSFRHCKPSINRWLRLGNGLPGRVGGLGIFPCGLR
jgi:hypothetical protein